MENKKNYLGILVILLVFGSMVNGCGMIGPITVTTPNPAVATITVINRSNDFYYISFNEGTFFQSFGPNKGAAHPVRETGTVTVYYTRRMNDKQGKWEDYYWYSKTVYVSDENKDIKIDIP